MKEVALSEVKDDLSRYLRQAAKEEIVITRHGVVRGVRPENASHGVFSPLGSCLGRMVWSLPPPVRNSVMCE